ncbi:hypothetical protein SAMN02745945_02806 [Peptoclostridium litorale DSM 5388]|uniref:Uncharacterized protein n=1 Tax=Peptoclostridium litorale DSM 5388 TaxID=1121324 RepID=A0A069RD05_PEPLI|nr:DUF6042 family protein [Peptoclostridium litorale]KDR94954.1 hypothetical protein CLIT_12c00220 [Peptoclostridium litorale DSM 5388]SIO33855.1 hypothetical protein SAMN02745945_02806 [Peptoclostridium litorale DSM 5388]
MQNKGQIKMPKEIHEYLWTRYLPETTFKLYVMVGYLQTEKIAGEQATALLLRANLPVENNNPAIIEEKKRILSSLGFEYPNNRKEDLELLLRFKLVTIVKNSEGKLEYMYTLPVPKPEDVLEIGEEEKQALENIKFEIAHQNAFNMLLTLVLNNNGSLMSTVGHIENTTRVKISEIRSVLAFLEEEGSIKINAHKDVNSLKKADKVHVTINKEIFEQKRCVLD